MTDLAGLARIVVRPNAVGTIKIQARLPYDGVVHTKPVTLTPDVEITGAP